jgi:hypothetical protein
VGVDSLQTFCLLFMGGTIHPDVIVCARCHLIVDDSTLSVDRIDPGGTYRRDNIRPACVPCQNTQGALITRERRYQWLAWVDEAAAAGIDWDGAM